MRTLFWLLALAAPLHAAPLTIDFGVQERISTNPLELPTRIRFRTSAASPSPLPTLEWLVEGLTAANIGQTFTVDATTAPDYGLDWPAFTFALAHPWHSDAFTSFPNNVYSFSSGNVGVTTSYRPPGMRYIVDSVESMELRVHEVFTNPLGSVLRWQHVAFGEGSIVPIPEPSAMVLLLIAGSVHVLRSRSRLVPRPLR